MKNSFPQVRLVENVTALKMFIRFVYADIHGYFATESFSLVMRESYLAIISK